MSTSEPRQPKVDWNVERFGPERPACRHDFDAVVAQRDALARQLRYAIDAIEGRPWTGWNTDVAKDVLDAA